MNIRKIPRWANLVFFRKPKGLALGNTVYLSDENYDLFMKGHPSVELEALIAHEAEHVRRLKIAGWGILFKYYLSRRFRLQEEIAATKAEIAVFKKNGQIFDYVGRARSWSSINYLFMVGYEEARKILIAL